MNYSKAKAKFFKETDNDDDDDNLDDIQERFFNIKKSKKISVSTEMPTNAASPVTEIGNPSSSSTSTSILNASTSYLAVDIGADLGNIVNETDTVEWKEAHELLRSVAENKRKYETKSKPPMAHDIDNGTDTTQRFDFQIPSVKTASERRTATVVQATIPSTASTSSTSSNIKRLKLKTRIGKATLSWSYPILFTFDQLQNCLIALSIKVPDSGLLFDGEPLDLKQTPKDYDMADEDIIDIKVGKDKCDAIIENVEKIIQSNGEQLSSNKDVKLTEFFNGKLKIAVSH